VVRSIDASKAVGRDATTWSNALAGRLLVRGNSYGSRRLAAAAEAPLFKEHCSLLI
jgi:hypothetical protein